MSAAERLHLEGKDWFTEAEAAEYCGVALSTFREGYRDLGIVPRRFLGRKMYARADLFQAIADSPAWQPSTSAAKPITSIGLKAATSSGDPSAALQPVRLRKYVPRKKPS
jgi:hypothetical protein